MTEDEVKAKWGRPASRANVGGFAPSEDPLASWFGRVLVALSGEDWPKAHGEPMIPMCQFNLTELPYRPTNLADIEFITFFFGPGESWSPNGDGWLLRAYKSLDGLTEIQEPKRHPDGPRPLPIRWELIKEDYPPKVEVIETLLPPVYERSTWEPDAEFLAFARDYRLHPELGTNIGGWPFPVEDSVSWEQQGDSSEETEFVFQIDSELKADWSWGDQGLAYIGRRPGTGLDAWVFQWQCY